MTTPRPVLPASLAAHERAVKRDFDLLGWPAKVWSKPISAPDGGRAVDVLVIGAGMCGIAVAASLRVKGVGEVRVVDRNPAGREGPWRTHARMDTLRSPKTLPGPALGIPALTFRAWYEASFGLAAWEALYKIPNAVWQDYLSWLIRVLEVPVENEAAVVAIEPQGDLVRVALDLAGRSEIVWARRVVVATGRAGAGGAAIPGFVDGDLWGDLAHHSADDIDFAALAGRRIAVVGGGSSAFYNAATALEAGVAAVDVFVRRPTLPQINKGRGSAHPGYFHGWPDLDDATRWSLLTYFADFPAPPPHETVLRALAHPGLTVHLGVAVERAAHQGERVRLFAAGGASHDADRLIVGTGFQVDLAAEPSLAALAPAVATWADRHHPPADLERPELGRFPYLGADFALQAKVPGSLPGLDRIHLYNFGAHASLRGLSDDIPGVDFGAARLAGALTSAIFREDIAGVRADVEAFAEPELLTTPYFAL